MNTGQRISTKVATAYFFGISIPTNAQDVLQRPERKVYGRLLLRAFSSCGGKMSGPKQMFTKAAVNKRFSNFTSVVRSVDTTRCFREAYAGLPVVRATENQKALNCVVLKYSIPVSEE